MAGPTASHWRLNRAIDRELHPLAGKSVGTYFEGVLLEEAPFAQIALVYLRRDMEQYTHLCG